MCVCAYMCVCMYTYTHSITVDKNVIKSQKIVYCTIGEYITKVNHGSTNLIHVTTVIEMPVLNKKYKSMFMFNGDILFTTRVSLHITLRIIWNSPSWRHHATAVIAEEFRVIITKRCYRKRMLSMRSRTIFP